MPYYTKNRTAGWTSENSLFAAFFGINDVSNSYFEKNTTLNHAIFKVYAGLIDEVGHADPKIAPTTISLMLP